MNLHANQTGIVAQNACLVGQKLHDHAMAQGKRGTAGRWPGKQETEKRGRELGGGT